MRFVQNFPFFTILLTLIGAVFCSVLSGRRARRLTLAVLLADLAMSAAVFADALITGETTVYWMGHFPAPWGNEIRSGILEGACMSLFMLVILLSFLGGLRRGIRELEESKYNLFCILVLLTALSLAALIYTNDLFTAYVFIEINTLAAAGLVMIRQNGKGLVGGVRYMIMNLLGSALFLIGVVILYTVTGHLLMIPIREQVEQLHATGAYRVPLLVVVSLMSVGLAMKSALFPFEKWLPGAYGNSTPTAQALLSSIVSKGYILLLVKVYVRVIGLPVIRSLGICDVLFVMGALGMIMGSVNALRARTVRMMTAYSSVAQIGYIFLALGLGTEAGVLCACWHTLAHAATKSMLFIAGGLLDGGDRPLLRRELRGGFWRSPVAAFAFALGACNLVGLPLLSAFVTKAGIAQAAIAVGGRHAAVALVCLAVSTVLNVGYFMTAAAELFTPDRQGIAPPAREDRLAEWSLAGFAVLNLAMGLFAGPLFAVLGEGLARFA